MLAVAVAWQWMRSDARESTRRDRRADRDGDAELEAYNRHLAELGREETGVITATLDLDRVRRHRAAFGFFRDRRPELYGRLVEDV